VAGVARCRRLKHPDRIPDSGVGALLAGTVLGLWLRGGRWQGS